LKVELDLEVVLELATYAYQSVDDGGACRPCPVVTLCALLTRNLLAIAISFLYTYLPVR